MAPRTRLFKKPRRSYQGGPVRRRDVKDLRRPRLQRRLLHRLRDGDRIRGPRKGTQSASRSTRTRRWPEGDRLANIAQEGWTEREKGSGVSFGFPSNVAGGSVLLNPFEHLGAPGDPCSTRTNPGQGCPGRRFKVSTSIYNRGLARRHGPATRPRSMSLKSRICRGARGFQGARTSRAPPAHRHGRLEWHKFFLFFFDHGRPRSGRRDVLGARTDFDFSKVVTEDPSTAGSVLRANPNRSRVHGRSHRTRSVRLYRPPQCCFCFVHVREADPAHVGDRGSRRNTSSRRSSTSKQYGCLQTSVHRHPRCRARGPVRGLSATRTIPPLSEII